MKADNLNNFKKTLKTFLQSRRLTLPLLLLLSLEYYFEINEMKVKKDVFIIIIIIIIIIKSSNIIIITAVTAIIIFLLLFLILLLSSIFFPSAHYCISTVFAEGPQWK